MEVGRHNVSLGPGRERGAGGADGGEIRDGIRPFLGRRDGGTVARFTLGSGTTGREREAYYVGWRVVGYLLGHVTSFAMLSHLREADMPALVDRTIGALLDEAHAKR